MSNRLTFVLALSAFTTAGCTKAELRYASPSAFDTPGVAADAQAGMSFYSLQTIFVDVGPTPPKEGTEAPKPGGKVTPPADDHGESAPVAKAEGANTGKDKGKTSKTDKPADEPAATPKPETENPTHVAAGTGQPSGPAGSVVINGQEIQATLRAVPDPNHGFLMGGTSGFWRKTAVTGTKYPNSDRVASVSVKAESLVARRIGQFATVAGYFFKPSAAGLTESASIIPPLNPFSFEVALNNNGKFNDVPGSPQWEYKLTFEAKPSGAVSWTTFNQLHAGKKVNYFPVPACLSAVLDLHVKVPEGQEPGPSYQFKSFVVSTPDIVRLEPLPVDGTLTLSAICSGTVEGTMTTDRYDEMFANAEALHKAYEDLTKKPEDKPESKPENKPDETAQ